jgi:hypothetical protein
MLGRRGGLNRTFWLFFGCFSVATVYSENTLHVHLYRKPAKLTLQVSDKASEKIRGDTLNSLVKKKDVYIFYRMCTTNLDDDSYQMENLTDFFRSPQDK